jgi:hypothetical protein
MTYQNQNTVHGEGEPGGKGNIWKAITISLVSIVVVICIVFFAVPLVKVPVQVVETYTDTEYKEEPYTESEPYTTQVTEQVTESMYYTFYDKDVAEIRRILPYVWVAEFYFNLNIIRKSNPVVSGSWEVLDTYTQCYVTINDPNFNQVYKSLGAVGRAQSDNIEFIPKLSGLYLVRFQTEAPKTIPKYAELTIVLKWDEVATKTTVNTEYREVTKYRQVPVEVTKQRTVTKYERVSVWRFLSSKTQAEPQ